MLGSPLGYRTDVARPGDRLPVFERRQELGGVWADGYAGFGVQVQKDLYEYPDWPLPPDAPDFTPGQVFREYLAAYSDAFDVTPRIRFRAERHPRYLARLAYTA